MDNEFKILIIEDDKYILNFTALALKTNGYQYISAKNGKEGIGLFCSNSPNLLLLDLGLPDMEGIEVIKTIRQYSQVPIIILSGCTQESAKINALDAGADDYMTKPFHMGELLARIRVFQRKQTNGIHALTSPIQLFICDYLTVDFEKHRVQVDKQDVHLTPIEFKLLSLLIYHRGKVLTHNFIMKEVWGYGDNSESTSVRVYMASLRRKIEKNTTSPRFILTEIGVGYRFAEE